MNLNENDRLIRTRTKHSRDNTEAILQDQHNQVFPDLLMLRKFWQLIKFNESSGSMNAAWN